MCIQATSVVNHRNAIGVGAGSLVLVAFGMTGLLDAAGSAALVGHFRHALHHETFSEHHERVALRVITVGLVVMGGRTAIESARRLAGKVPSHATPAGLVIAAMSIVLLALLSQRRRRVAERVASRALLVDAWLSATGCLLAAA